MAGNNTAPCAVGKLRVSELRQEIAWARRPLRQRVLLTYGAFDGMAADQVRLLHHLASLCDRLIVGCTTDALLAARGQPARLPFAQRRAMLEKCRAVDRVIAEETDTQHRTDIVNCNAAILAVQDHQTGRFDALEDIAQVLHVGAAQSVSMADAHFRRVLVAKSA